MTEFIQLLILASLWVWGVHLIFKPKQILGWLGDAAREEWPLWLYKPTIGCPQCMASVHGTIIHMAAYTYSLYHHNGMFSQYSWIPFIICLAGLNHIITEFLYDTTED